MGMVYLVQSSILKVTSFFFLQKKLITNKAKKVFFFSYFWFLFDLIAKMLNRRLLRTGHLNCIMLIINICINN